MLAICTYVTEICPFECLFTGFKSNQYKSSMNQYWTRKLEFKIKIYCYLSIDWKKTQLKKRVS